MYKLSLLLLICVAVFAGCDKKDASDCPVIACTEMFASIPFSFTDKDGIGVPVKNYSAVNLRTGESIESPNVAYLTIMAGTYIVADDSHLRSLSEEGDDISITGTYEATGQTKSAIIKVSGGKCACHIQKISGPDKIIFD